jgi:hypothetical protein
VAMLRVLFDLLWTRDQTHLPPEFPTPAFAKNAKNGAPTMLVMLATSKAWATRRESLK